MGFIIDTCIWISVERGLVSPGDVAAYTKNHPVYLTPITIAELKYGAEIAANADIKQRRLMAYAKIKTRPCLGTNSETGEIFAQIAGELKRSKREHEYRIQDLWIASIAIQNSFPLLTHNKKDFEDIPGLDLIVMPTP